MCTIFVPVRERERLACEVLRAADARRAARIPARLRLDLGHQLRDVAAFTTGADHHTLGTTDDQRDRREVLDRVEAELHEVRRDRLRGVGREQQRVAVGRRLRGDVRGDGVRRARGGSRRRRAGRMPPAAFRASMRARMSVPPPGEAPTMIFTGLVGHGPAADPCAAASVQPSASTSAQAKWKILVFIGLAPRMVS